jgi:hypothetical protein
MIVTVSLGSVRDSQLPFPSLLRHNFFGCVPQVAAVNPNLKISDVHELTQI